MEFFSGICLLFGPLARFWAADFFIDMTVVVIEMHSGVGFFWLRSGGGLEFPMTLGSVALAIFCMGPSFLSVDRAIGLERSLA